MQELLRMHIMQWYSMNIDHNQSFTSLFEQEDSFLLLFFLNDLMNNSDFLVRSIEDIDGK